MMMTRQKMTTTTTRRFLLAVVAVLAIAALSLTVHEASAARGIDLSFFQGNVTLASWQCIRAQGNSIAIVQGTRGSSGSVNPYVVDLLRGAHAAGIPFVDVYVFLNFKRGEPAVQMREVLDFIQASGQRFGMLWHDIEGPKYFGECPENRKFLQEALAEGERRGIRQGIYSSASQWQPIMCGAEEFSHYPLWYAHYDNRPDFSSFRPFGGWDRPVMKQYMGTTDLCGTQVDLNFYP